MLAAAPIAVVLVLMVFFRWGGSRAGPAGWLAALITGSLVFEGGPRLLAYSQLEAVLLTLYVLYIIWMAVVRRIGLLRQPARRHRTAPIFPWVVSKKCGVMSKSGRAWAARWLTPRP
jgi:hypothetical protein